jgi:hypothetical protein
MGQQYEQLYLELLAERASTATGVVSAALSTPVPVGAGDEL